MPGYRKFKASDWPLYVEEVHSLYIGERKQVKELVEHFRQRYGIEITYGAPSAPAFSVANEALETTSSRSSSRGKERAQTERPGPRTSRRASGKPSTVSSTRGNERESPASWCSTGASMTTERCTETGGELDGALGLGMSRVRLSATPAEGVGGRSVTNWHVSVSNPESLCHNTAGVCVPGSRTSSRLLSLPFWASGGGNGTSSSVTELFLHHRLVARRRNLSAQRWGNKRLVLGNSNRIGYV